MQHITLSDPVGRVKNVTITYSSVFGAVEIAGAAYEVVLSRHFPRWDMRDGGSAVPCDPHDWAVLLLVRDDLRRLIDGFRAWSKSSKQPDTERQR